MHIKLKQLSSVVLHTSCYTNYIRPKSIKATAKAATAASSKTRQENSEARHFDFSQFCFFCDNLALKSTPTISIKHVKTDETRLKILQTLLDRCTKDEFSKKLYTRLAHVDDLSQMQARYHAACMTKFYTYRSTNVVGRPPNPNITNFLEYLIMHILNNNDECQFSLKNIIDSYTGEIPEIRTIKKKITRSFWRRHLFLFG